MRNIMLLILLMSALALSAQLIDEDFESCYEDSNGVTILPEGWTMADQDADGENWFYYNHSAHSGEVCLASASYSFQSGALTPDNWLISPAVTLSDSCDLSWWAAIQDPSYPIEHYSVLLSTAGPELENFTHLLYSETMGAENFTWEQHTVELSEFAGETVNIAWRHHASTDMFYMKIDDVYIGGEVGSNENSLIAKPCELKSVFPNPFNPVTTVNFYLEENGKVNLSVYNIKGQLVQNLVNSNLEQGEHNIVWQAENQPSGMYFFRLLTPAGVSSSKAVLLK